MCSDRTLLLRTGCSSASYHSFDARAEYPQDSVVKRLPQTMNVIHYFALVDVLLCVPHS